ncbi:Protein NRT1/ PTR FAMILY 5.9 [Hibiscus syriacus]|uniref:Protein NRT1/ PTR FAMILY 5.9 n=1 Tax=Hibiscus syriacus TaxID=106335 RepID=A0A6A3BQE9_HIBSY|nr:protein NRT1/ PTR FAMILY 5.9-like [Hibiscus syriacus]KAE8717149.1 Protein NRT1/ PTR FAMILY 5.9 [Hibiscus syriacus]
MAEEGRAGRLSKSCILLIVLAGMERFAFKGVASNLVTYLTDVMKMRNSEAAKTVNSWCGLTSMLPLLVAPLADSFWDRYSTILTSSFLYVLGLGAVASTALAWTYTPPSTASSFAFLFGSLCLVSLGQGAYNPSLQAFGADQLDRDDEFPCTIDDQNSSKKKGLFFQWWYFGVCTGSLLGVILMSYIQDTFGWVLGFAIPMFAMIISVTFFVCGRRIYAHKQDRTLYDKPFMKMFRAKKETASRLINGGITLQDEKSDIVELELQQRPLCDQKHHGNEGSDSNLEPNTYLIENAKIVLRLLPIWTMLLIFAVIFQQPATFFTKQGMTMRRNVGKNFKIPPATLQSSITLSIILLMPLYDKVLIPITKMVTRNEKGITVMQRMGVGMFLSVIAMIIAAVVERTRLETSRKIGNQESVPLSIFWLLPQYVLLGISDIFTVVGMQEFFYNEVPVRMRTMGFALYTSVFGVGSFLSALMISVIEAITGSDGRQSWFSDDMREDGLDKLYWLLAIASALSLLFYAIFCKCYTSRIELENAIVNKL